MKNLKKAGLRVLSAAAMMSMLASTTAFAGQWQKNDSGWWYDNGNGTWPAATWQWIDGNNDGTSECYYFDSNGYMLSNTTTPDGYMVNADGAWTENGVVQLQSISTPVSITKESGGSTATEESGDYPLKGMVEKYFGVEDGNLVWYWRGPHVIMEGIVPAGMTGWSYVYQQAIEDRDPNYHAAQGGYSLSVLGKLAGYPVKTLCSDYAEVAELYNEVKKFMDSFDWRNASDLEKATRICNRIHQASYDYDAANEAATTGWSDSLSYGAYGCLVKGKAVCQGYAEAAELLSLCVGLKVGQMGSTVNHTYPVFLVDGIWLGNEPTTQNKYFTVEDVYEYNPGYKLLLALGEDTSELEGSKKYQLLGQYCYGVGYTVPTELSQLPDWPGKSAETLFGKQALLVYFR